MRVPVAGWSGFLISHSLWAGSHSCSAVSSLPRERDLGTCREPERVWSFPTSFACQCSPSCFSPSCPDELLRNSSLFIRIKPKSCPSRGHPSELPAPQVTSWTREALAKELLWSSPHQNTQPLSLRLLHATTPTPAFPLGWGLADGFELNLWSWFVFFFFFLSVDV